MRVISLEVKVTCDDPVQMSFGYDLLSAVGTQNTNIRAISSTWPVFGSTHDLGNVSESPTPVMALRYIVAGGAATVHHCSVSVAATADCLVAQLSDKSHSDKFLNLWTISPGVLNRPDAFNNNKINNDVSNIPSDYVNVLALSDFGCN